MLKTTGISQRDFCRFWHTLRYEIFLKGEVRHVETNGRISCRRSLRRRLVGRTGLSGAGCPRYGERERRLYDVITGETPSTAAGAAGSSSHSCAAAHSAYTPAYAASASASSGTASPAAAPSGFTAACAAAGQTPAGT